MVKKKIASVMAAAMLFTSIPVYGADICVDEIAAEEYAVEGPEEAFVETSELNEKSIEEGQNVTPASEETVSEYTEPQITEEVLNNSEDVILEEAPRMAVSGETEIEESEEETTPSQIQETVWDDLLEDENGIMQAEYVEEEALLGGAGENNQFEAHAKEQVIYVPFGGDATLEVVVSAQTGSLTYQWYRLEAIDGDVSNQMPKEIEGATGRTYTVENVQEACDYLCEVKDCYENPVWVSASVGIENHLTGEQLKLGGYVKQGGTITLGVKASAQTGNLTYQWYYMGENGSEIVTGATEPVYTVENVQKSCDYMCLVSDIYGNNLWIFCPINFVSQNIKPGQMIEMAVSSDDPVACAEILPDISGSYKITTEEGDRLICSLIDSDGNILEQDLVISGNTGVSLSAELKAGKGYCLRIEIYTGDDYAEGTAITEVLKVHVELEGQCSHNWGDYVVTQEATALAEGIKTRTCSICGEIETAPVAKLQATGKVSASSVPLKTGQSTAGLKVTEMAKGDYVAAWKSSNTGIVKVSGKQNGTCKLTAQKKAGSAKLTITLASGKVFNVTVKVQKPKVKTTKVSVTNVTKGKLTLEKGKKFTLKTSCVPFTTQEQITYSSNKKAVATVSAKGVITAKGAGKAVITVKSGSKTAKVTVTVPKAATKKISGVKSAVTLKKGKKLTLKPKRTPSNSADKITYTTSNKKVATVSAKGVITAKGKGTATITVKSGKISVKCKVTVK